MRRIVSIVAMFAVLLGGFAVFAACGNGDEGGELFTVRRRSR